jgi:hypothetical protein
MKIEINSKAPKIRQLKLKIEMVPSSSWNQNLKNILKKDMWDKIRKSMIRKYAYRCAICGKREKALQAHEVWDYKEQNHIQKLVDIVPLCALCHGVKHIGFTSLKQQDKEKFIRHFMRVNHCDRVLFQKHLASEIKKFEKRSRFDWQLDIGQLKNILI